MRTFVHRREGVQPLYGMLELVVQVHKELGLDSYQFARPTSNTLPKPPYDTQMPDINFTVNKNPPPLPNTSNVQLAEHGEEVVDPETGKQVPRWREDILADVTGTLQGVLGDMTRIDAHHSLRM